MVHSDMGNLIIRNTNKNQYFFFHLLLKTVLNPIT